MQLTLILDAPRARRRDPVSSHQAALKARDFQLTHAGRILAALRKHGPMNADEIGRHAGLSLVAVDRRLAELKRAQQVRDYLHAGQKVYRPTSEGRLALVVEAV